MGFQSGISHPCLVQDILCTTSSLVKLQSDRNFCGTESSGTTGSWLCVLPGTGQTYAQRLSVTTARLALRETHIPAASAAVFVVDLMTNM